MTLRRLNALISHQCDHSLLNIYYGGRGTLVTISGTLNSDIDNTKYVQYVSNVSKD